MSRLTDLIVRAKAKDQKLGAYLDRGFKVLSSRLPFGLNLERHRLQALSRNTAVLDLPSAAEYSA